MKRFLNLYFILFLGAFFRILCAFTSLGFEHPNENYRLLEPLAAMNGYSARLPWEWTEGLLSHLPVLFHHFYLVALSELGWTSALAQLIGLRLLYGMLSLFQILAAWRLTLRTSNSKMTAGLAALLVAVWPEIIYRSVRLMDYSLEASMLAISLMLVFTTHRRNREIYVALAAGVLGFLFFERFQSGMYFVAILSVLVFMRPYRWTEAIYFIGFYGLTIAFFAVIEAQGVRHLLVPFFKYIEFNVFQNGAARYYGNEPWHRYFSELAKSFGFVPLLVTGYALFKKRMDSKILFIFILPLFILSLISHKEARFIYGFAWLLIPLTVVGSKQLVGSRLRLQVVALCFLIGFLINLERVSRRVEEGAETVRQWSEIGKKLEGEASTEKKLPLYVYGDPDFLPGGFFLRFTGPICYKYGDSRQGMCLKSVNRFRTLHLNGETWTLSAVQEI